MLAHLPSSTTDYIGSHDDYIDKDDSAYYRFDIYARLSGGFEHSLGFYRVSIDRQHVYKQDVTADTPDAWNEI